MEREAERRVGEIGGEKSRREAARGSGNMGLG